MTSNLGYLTANIIFWVALILISFLFFLRKRKISISVWSVSDEPGLPAGRSEAGKSESRDAVFNSLLTLLHRVAEVIGASILFIYATQTFGYFTDYLITAFILLAVLRNRPWKGRPVWVNSLVLLIGLAIYLVIVLDGDPLLLSYFNGALIVLFIDRNKEKTKAEDPPKNVFSDFLYQLNKARERVCNSSFKNSYTRAVFPAMAIAVFMVFFVPRLSHYFPFLLQEYLNEQELTLDQKTMEPFIAHLTFLIYLIFSITPIVGHFQDRLWNRGALLNTLIQVLIIIIFCTPMVTTSMSLFTLALHLGEAHILGSQWLGILLAVFLLPHIMPTVHSYMVVLSTDIIEKIGSLRAESVVQQGDETQ